MTAYAISWPGLSIDPPARKTASMSEFAEPSDEELVAATLRGDEGAFTDLIARHKRRVFGTAARFARDAHQLDDIAQEVFVRAFRNLGKFRHAAPFEHWLARITVSACYDFLRKERRQRAQLSLDEFPIDLADVRADAALSAGRAREILEWALTHLEPEERLIITLSEIEEQSVRDIAALTGWSEAKVKVRAFRARQSLKKVLQLHHEL